MKKPHWLVVLTFAFIILVAIGKVQIERVCSNVEEKPQQVVQPLHIELPPKPDIVQKDAKKVLFRYNYNFNVPIPKKRTREPIPCSTNTTNVNYNIAPIFPQMSKGEQENLFHKQMLAKNAERILWERLHNLQYPKEEDCASRNLLICRMGAGVSCGFGCQLHHFAYCMVYGLATGRTVVFDENYTYEMMQGEGVPETWKYAKGCAEPQWECYFDLVTTCKSYGLSQKPEPAVPHSKARVITISFRTSREYIEWTPPDLLPLIKQFHSRPQIWFVGQIMKWLLRPNAGLKAKYERLRYTVLKDFKRPILGIHMRGDDKGIEVPIKPFEQYLEYAPKNFTTIFLATDDKLNVEKTKSYPNITWVMVKSEKNRVSGVGDRYAMGALANLVMDIYLLSECDHFIGTDSSQISRSAYELMQTHHVDASDRGWSLETILIDHRNYFFWYFI